MKIAVTAQRDCPAAMMDPRFGRAALFMVWDDAQKSWCSRSNQQNLEAVQGAGIQAAQQLIEADVNVVITGHCGPKAFRLLKEAGVTVYTCSPMTVEAAVQALAQQLLTKIEQADVEGHWA